MKSENCQSDLNQFCKQVYDKDQAGVDLVTEHLSNILTSATEVVTAIKPINSIREGKINGTKNGLTKTSSNLEMKSRID